MSGVFDVSAGRPFHDVGRSTSLRHQKLNGRSHTVPIAYSSLSARSLALSRPTTCNWTLALSALFFSAKVVSVSLYEIIVRLKIAVSSVTRNSHRY